MQGHDWPDAKILGANGINVETDFRYEEIFKLISLGRYDFFPRGVLEAFSELDNIPVENLAVSPDFVIAYPAPTYFFVKNEDHKLAERVEAGVDAVVLLR